MRHLISMMRGLMSEADAYSAPVVESIHLIPLIIYKFIFNASINALSSHLL